MALRERTVLNEQVFKRLPQLKLVLQTGGHAYHIDTAAAQRRNIIITLGRTGKSSADFGTGTDLCFWSGLMHKVYEGNRAMQRGEWKLLTGRTLSNRRLGILGLGRHGSRVAHIARTAFNMEVVAWRRSENTYETGDGIKRLALDELLETSDVV
jgi:phosphoglycerate dehydrogenase-like enzyme